MRKVTAPATAPISTDRGAMLAASSSAARAVVRKDPVGATECAQRAVPTVGDRHLPVILAKVRKRLTPDQPEGGDQVVDSFGTAALSPSTAPPEQVDVAENVVEVVEAGESAS